MTLRSHRLLREVHAGRLSRMGEARGRGSYDGLAEVRGFETNLGLLAGEGHFDRDPLFDPIVALGRGIADVLLASLREGDLASDVGCGVAAVALAERRTSNGRYRIRPSDREVAKQCMALAEAAIVERLYRAASVVLRHRAATDHRERACWPTSSRRAEDGTQSSLRADERRTEAAEAAV